MFFITIMAGNAVVQKQTPITFLFYLVVQGGFIHPHPKSSQHQLYVIPGGILLQERPLPGDTVTIRAENGHRITI